MLYTDTYIYTQRSTPDEGAMLGLAYLGLPSWIETLRMVFLLYADSGLHSVCYTPSHTTARQLRVIE